MSQMPSRNKLLTTLQQGKTVLWNRWLQMSNANLRDAYLQGADLQGANLQGANLRYADLRYADLQGANLENTILDPNNTCSDLNTISQALLTWDIIPNKHGNFKAYRTKVSRYVGNTTYEQGKTYSVPYFSTDENTACHPGLYFTSKDIALSMSKNIVAVVANVKDVVIAGGKARCRKFRVVSE